MRDQKTKRLAQAGLLTALALIAGYVESLIPISIGIPGVKLGLANLVIVWALYMGSPAETLTIDLMRVLLSGFLFGSLSMILYGLAGALLSLGCMLIAKKSGALPVLGVSIVGGITHNIGQLLVAMVVLETKSLIYYGPVLLIAGLVTGLLIGIVSGEVLKRVRVRM